MEIKEQINNPRYDLELVNQLDNKTKIVVNIYRGTYLIQELIYRVIDEFESNQCAWFIKNSYMPN